MISIRRLVARTVDRIVIRSGHVMHRGLLKRIRRADRAIAHYDEHGLHDLAREWRDRRARMEYRFREMDADLAERVAEYARAHS